MAYVVVNLFVILLNLIIGIFALIQSKQKKSAIVFFSIIISATLWSLFISLIELNDSLDSKVTFARLSFLGPNFLPILLLYFTKLFPFEVNLFKSKRLENILISFLIVVTLILQLISVFTSELIKSASLDGNLVKYEYGSLYLPYFIFFAGSILLLLYFLFKKYSNSEGIDRLRLKFIFLGFSITAIFAISTNLLEPILGNDEISKLGPVSTIFLFLFTSYSVIAHRLFDIGTFLVKILEPIVIGTFLYLIVFLVRTFEIQILKIDFYDPINITIDYIACVLVAMVIAGVLRFTNNILSSVLVNNNIDITNLLQSLEENLSSVLDTKTAVESFAKVSSVFFPQTKVYFCQIYEDKIIETKTKELIDIDTNWVLEVSNQRTVYITQENDDPVATKLKEKKISMVGILSEEYFIIFLDKSDNQVYTKLELDSLELVVEKLRTSWERIKLHQQTEDFNKTLQQKVEEATRKIQEQKEQIEDAYKAERDRMNILSHELRTPLGTARNSVSMLKMLYDSGKLTQDNEVVPTTIDRALENLRREVVLLERIFTVSQIRAGTITARQDKVNCNEVVTKALTDFRHIADKKGVQVIVNVPQTPIEITSDLAKVNEIIGNIFENSAKYTNQGSITISLEDQGDKVKFTIVDTGIGIPKDEIPKLGLHEYYKVNTYLPSSMKSNTAMPLTRPDGTGMGMFVIKNLAKLINAELVIESEVGKGTKMEVILGKIPNK